jgi:hypothetical protein
MIKTSYKKLTVFLIFILSAHILSAQNNPDSLMLRNIYDFNLTQSECYENLRHLCKKIGHRLSGSVAAEKAVDWAKQLMQNYDFDTVYLQEVMVPHWIRGNIENAFFSIENDKLKNNKKLQKTKVNITALGGSVGTNGPLSAELIEVNGIDELKKLNPELVKNKIVFLNKPMEPTFISTFQSYGGCASQRVWGADEASRYGAKAVIIRSLTHANDNHPHTGSVVYQDSVARIPAAAISTEWADKIHKHLLQGDKVIFTLHLNCEILPDVKSYNVIGEIKGSVNPEKIILVGGHLDSWDIGEGAHDDGAGIVQSIEVLHTFKKLGIRPKHTIRAVLFMNEENGLRGAKKYAQQTQIDKVYHLAAIESDRGGFVPRGFSLDCTHKQYETIKSWSKLFEPYQVHLFEQGGTGADIVPLKNGQICLIGFVPDSQRYFDHHHAETDVFENVNKRELQLGSATITALVYLIDKYGL